MSTRFFSETPIDHEATEHTLDGAEAHHMIKVMRSRVGDQVTLFDGSDFEFAATIQSVARDKVIVSLDGLHKTNRERTIPIHLAVALPKGDRQRFLIEKAVELGVDRLTAIKTQLSQEAFSQKSISRWERYVIDASKQCRRNRLMQCEPPTTFSELCTGVPSTFRWIAHPASERAGQSADIVSLDSLCHPTPALPMADTSAENMADTSAENMADAWAENVADTSAENKAVDSADDSAPNTSPSISLLVGPEGGFTDDEFRMARDYGWRQMDLGPRILRIETACVVAICLAELAALMGSNAD